MEEEIRAKHRQIFIDIFVNDPYMNKLFHDGDPWHIETSPWICCANQWTGFYIIGITVMKEQEVY